MGVITLGPLDIYILGFDRDNDLKYMVVKFNIYYITVVPCYISYIYRGIIIYLKSSDNKKMIKKLKEICSLTYFFTVIYTIIIDLLYFYNYLKMSKIYYYPYYIITIIYSIIIHPIIIYLLYKIKNKILYDYILTMIITTFSIGIFIILTFININEKNTTLNILFIIKDYWASIGGMLNYISYIIIPLIYLIKESSKFLEKNNTITSNDNNVKLNDIDSININIIKKYQEIKNQKFKDNHEIKEVYKIFYIHNVKKLKNYDKYKDLIYDITSKIETDNIEINIFDKLLLKIQNDILLNIYNKQNNYV